MVQIGGLGLQQGILIKYGVLTEKKNILKILVKNTLVLLNLNELTVQKEGTLCTQSL